MYRLWTGTNRLCGTQGDIISRIISLFKWHHKILRENFKNLALEAKNNLNLKNNDLIVDIGSNDGTLLKPFKELGFNVLGVEPSQAADLAIKSGINTEKTYFNKEQAIKIKQKYGNASVVTAANVFAHIHDVHEIVAGIKELCDDGGVFISESHYLLGLLKTVQYDTVYHEHLRYYSVIALQELFKKHDLEIFDVKHIPTHGGSIRVYTSKKGSRTIKSSVTKIIQEERDYGLLSSDNKCYIDFANNIKNSKLKLLNILTNIKLKGQKIFAIGAPSRASTLFSYVGLDETIIDGVMEVSNSHKLNKYMPGTKIPILDEEALYKEQPEYALFGSWHIAEELSEIIRNKGYKGKFIVPLPEPMIMENEMQEACVL